MGSGTSEHHPRPAGPAVMEMAWRDLLFAHWAFEPEVIAGVLPRPLVPDVFDGRAWIGLVPFTMPRVRALGLAVPGAAAFHECNLRTYVTVGGEPGVYFFSLDAASWLAAMGARLGLGLRYYYADIRMGAYEAGSAARGESGIWRVISYRLRRHGRWPGGRLTGGHARRPAMLTGRTQDRVPSLAVDWSVGEHLEPSRPGSLAWFLTERYCLYTVGPGDVPVRCRIWHPRWPLRQAEVTRLRETLLSAAGVRAVAEPVHLVASDGVDVQAWPPEPAG